MWSWAFFALEVIFSNSVSVADLQFTTLHLQSWSCSYVLTVSSNSQAFSVSPTFFTKNKQISSLHTVMKSKLAEGWHCKHIAFKFTVKIEDLFFTWDLLSHSPLDLSLNIHRIIDLISRQWCHLPPSVKFGVLSLIRQLIRWQIKGFNKLQLGFWVSANQCWPQGRSWRVSEVT